MFTLLTQVLLWLLIGVILWYLFIKFIPRVYLTWLGGLILFAFIVLAFLDPTDRVVSSVWEILSLPLKPLGLTLVLLASALRKGVKSAEGNLVAIAFLVLWLSSTPIVAYWLTAQSTESTFYTIQQLEDPTPDPRTTRAIVVLAESISPTDPSYQIRNQFTGLGSEVNASLVPRLLYAGQLYREQANQGNYPLVIVSVGLDEDDTEEINSVRDTLITAGVPQDRISIDTESDSVRNAALEIEELLADRGFREETEAVIVVSPALSICRASSTFTRAGINVIPRPTDFFDFQLEGSGILARMSDLIPDVEALTLTTRAVDEYLTSIYYFLRGWLIDPRGRTCLS